ncbi:hypothetical protein C0989_011433 [Termitomyces sp. Mn162]|nr:hypothetical protein C0989_011433 [Termitomyces sp. Mn162]
MSIQFTQPTLVEESEAEDLPIKKVARNRKKARGYYHQAAEDSGWEDNNIFQSGAESSSPVRPSPIRPKTTRKSVPGSQKSRKSSSAPPQMPFSSPSGVPDFSDPERMSPLPPPQFKFEPNLSNSPMAQLHSKQSQSANFTPFQRRVPVFDTKREDDRDGFDVMSDNFSVANQVEPTNENTLAVLEEQDEVEGSSFTDLGAVEDCINAEFESVTEGGKHLDKRQGIAYGRIVFYGSMCLLTVIAFSAVISHKMDSASIGYCDAGSSTNSNLEQRRAERAAAEPWNSIQRLALSHLWFLGDLRTVVLHARIMPIALQPVFYVIMVTLCDRTLCCSSSQLRPPRAIQQYLFPPLQWTCFGRCIEDPERKKKIGSLGKAIESFLGQERGRRLCAGGETLKEPIDDSDGGDVKKWGMELENLREIMQKKTHPHLLLSFDDMFDEAIQQLTQWGGVMIGKDHTNLRYVAHKTPSLTWDCVITVKFRKFWVEWRPIIIGFMFVVLSFVYWRARNAQKRVENQRVADLVQIALDTLRNQEFAHHTDPVTTPQPYLSSLQLRDLILQDEHSVTSRSRLWDQVERVVEGNANVRANLQEIQGGDEMRVWRWIGSARRKTNPSR